MKSTPKKKGRRVVLGEGYPVYYGEKIALYKEILSRKIKLEKIGHGHKIRLIAEVIE